MNEYTFSELETGLKEQFEVTISEEMMTCFCELSGDTNPLHTNSDYAQSRNMKERVVYGLLTASFYSTLVGVHLPGKYAILQGINITFNKPVFVGDQLGIMGEITYINDAFKVVEIKAKIQTQNGKKVSSAKITVGLFQ
jgi:3-hydroxybutyryl-CoA dehydratase